MPKCKNDDKKTYIGTEPSPKGRGWCAHAEKIGTIKKGLDGFMWVIIRTVNNIKRWKRVIFVKNYNRLKKNKSKKNKSDKNISKKNKSDKNKSDKNNVIKFKYKSSNKSIYDFYGSFIIRSIYNNGNIGITNIIKYLNLDKKYNIKIFINDKNKFITYPKIVSIVKKMISVINKKLKIKKRENEIIKVLSNIPKKELLFWNNWALTKLKGNNNLNSNNSNSDKNFVINEDTIKTMILLVLSDLYNSESLYDYYINSLFFDKRWEVLRNEVIGDLMFKNLVNIVEI